MPLKPAYTGRFKRDVKVMQRRGFDMQKLKVLMGLLIEQQPLDPRHRDHPLSGPWNGHRDCHVEPDWVLIYRIILDENEIRFERTGTHSGLF